MGERVLILTLVLVLGGCTLLRGPAQPQTEAVTVPVPAPPPEWMVDPLGYGERLRDYDATARRNLVDEALAEFAANPGIATHTRLALVLDNAVLVLREHLEATARIEHMLGDEMSLDTRVAAVLRVQIDRLNARVANLQSLAAARKHNNRLTRQVRQLESSQSETEAALEVAREQIEALKSIEQSLRRK